MPKYLHLQIPEPCHEDWNKMDPQAQGRFCNSCQKTVTDFTNMSDAQLIAFFKNPKPSVCGRFAGEQLERDILIPRKRIPWIKYFFQFALPAFLLFLRSNAQSIRIKSPIEKFDLTTKGKFLPVIGDTTSPKSTTISGTVKDTEGNPVPYATIYIKGTLKGTAADSLGNFFIDHVVLPCTVSVSCVGFTPTEVHLAYNQKQSNIKLQIQPAMQRIYAGGVISVRSVTRRKTKKELKKEACTNAAASLSVYPNPISTSSRLHLQWENFEGGNYRIEIYNIASALIKSQKQVVNKGITETSLTIDELAAGNYFIRLINEKTGRQLSQQFMVQE